MTQLLFKIIYCLLMIATLAFWGKSYAVTALAAANPSFSQSDFAAFLGRFKLLALPLTIDPEKLGDDPATNDGGSQSQDADFYKTINNMFLHDKALADALSAGYGRVEFLGRLDIKSNLVVIIYGAHFPWGGSSEDYHLVTYTPEGKQIDSVVIAGSGGDVESFVSIKATISLQLEIQAVKTITTGADNQQKKFVETYLSHKILPDGKIKVLK